MDKQDTGQDRMNCQPANMVYAVLNKYLSAGSNRSVGHKHIRKLIKIPLPQQWMYVHFEILAI